MAASKKENMNAGRVEYLGDDREGKLAALNNAVAAIEKNYGKGSIMKLGDSSAKSMVRNLVVRQPLPFI